MAAFVRSCTRWENFRAYMQQTREQYGWWLASREPMQWMMPTERGSLPFFISTFPPVGPVEFRICSNSSELYTLSRVPYPYCAIGVASKMSKPVDTRI